MAAPRAPYPPPGSIVTHDDNSYPYLYVGPWPGVPGWGTVLPEIHPGEFNPRGERIVRMDALIVVEPAVGWERETDGDAIASSLAERTSANFRSLAEVMDSVDSQAKAATRDRACIADLRLILEEIKEWDIGHFQNTGVFALPRHLRILIDRATTHKATP